MQKIIKKLTVPKVLLRYIIMNFTNMQTIEYLILNVKIMNVLDNYSKDILAKAKKGFGYNCLNGHLTVAKWLYVLGDIDIHANNEYAFRFSCMHGHLTVVKWLYSLGDVDIHADNEEAFRWSCYYGHLPIAQWLYSLGSIDIHRNNEQAFRFSCYNNHLTVAKWLYSIGSDIHAQNDYVFRYCGKKALSWLLTIKN